MNATILLGSQHATSEEWADKGWRLRRCRLRQADGWAALLAATSHRDDGHVMVMGTLLGYYNINIKGGGGGKGRIGKMGKKNPKE